MVERGIGESAHHRQMIGIQGTELGCEGKQWVIGSERLDLQHMILIGCQCYPGLIRCLAGSQFEKVAGAWLPSSIRMRQMVVCLDQIADIHSIKSGIFCVGTLFREVGFAIGLSWADGGLFYGYLHR